MERVSLEVEQVLADMVYTTFHMNNSRCGELRFTIHDYKILKGSLIFIMNNSDVHAPHQVQIAIAEPERYRSLLHVPLRQHEERQ